jgi:hypothetical protein
MPDSLDAQDSSDRRKNETIIVTLPIDLLASLLKPTTERGKILNRGRFIFGVENRQRAETNHLFLFYVV